MADQSNIFDIGGASTEVWLTTWGSSLYDADGITPLTTHVGGYQEAWIDTQASQLNAAAHYSRLFSAEHWVNQWDIVSPNWRVVPQLGGAILNYNQTPDAPMQTLCYGRVQTKLNGNDIPDICVPEGEIYAPPISSYIQTDVNVGPSIPGGAGSSAGSLPAANGQALFENVAVGGTGIPDLPAGIQQQLAHTDTPFKPSSVDFIARRKAKSTQWADDYITNTIQKIGIQLHNVWYMSSPTSDGRTYIRNFGPSWGKTTYAGPQFSQEGGIGNLRVKVTANKGSATMRRTTTLDKCIGRDERYRWIFPYIDKGGYLSHEVQSPLCQNVETGIGEGGKELELDGPPPNIGFILKMDVTSEASRGSFFGSGGGSPQVKVMWGGTVRGGGITPSNVTQSLDHGWADGFEVYVTPDKTPYLTFWDGTKTAKAFLASSPVSDMSSVTLRVEYFGTSMLVTLNENRDAATLIKGYSQMKSNEQRYGVYVTNNSLAFQISNCTATFSCMPIYYNPWSTTQSGDFTSGDVTNPSSGGNDATTGFNEKLEFRYWQQQDSENLNGLFYSGMAKLASMALFHLPPAKETSQAQAQAAALVDKVLENLALQTPNTKQIHDQTPTWARQDVTAVEPFYHQDEGWPPFIRDSRQRDCNGDMASSPLQLTSTYIPDLGKEASYSWLPSVPQTSSNSDWPIGAGSPTMLSTDSTTVSIIFSVNTTHTTPLVFGFKADGIHDKLPFRNAPYSERLKSTSWTVTWSASGGEAGTVGKVMTASASATIVEPSPEAIFALANNQMRLRVINTGYRDTSLATDENQGVLGKALYLGGCLFDGITTKMSISRNSGGKVVLTITAADPVMMLERTMLESNLRFDGNSYVTAVCSLMRHTDYINMFEIRFGAKGEPGVNVGPSWMGTKRIELLLSDLGLDKKIPYFGYQPGIGRVYEVGPGEMVMTHIANILQKMDSPIFIPLLYYDPTTAKFVLTRRLRSGGSSPDGLAGGAGGKLWLIDAPQGTNITNAWDAAALKGGLLLQAAKGGPLYSLESITDHLLSQYVAFGTNRITGSPQKGTAMNPNWNSLAAGTKDKWGTTYGHIGYRAKVVEKQAANFLPDQTAVNRYTWGRMWWRSRAIMRISGLVVDGIVFPGSGGSGGGIDDGCVGVVIGNEAFPYTMLENVKITYDAIQQRVQSELSVAVFPPSPPGSNYGQTPTSTTR